MEHLMKPYEMNRIWSGLWKSDVFVKDKENVDAAFRILQDEVRQEYTWKWDSVVYAGILSVILVSKRGQNLLGLQLYS